MMEVDKQFPKIYKALLSYNPRKTMMIAPWKETRWLVLSSSFFILPAIYAYWYQLYFFTGILTLTSIVSANYWRICSYSWRRNMDLVFAKVSFVVFFYNGIVYVKYTPYLITGYSGVILAMYCWYTSEKVFQSKDTNWWKYHFLFHCLLTLEQLMVLNSIVDSSHRIH